MLDCKGFNLIRLAAFTKAVLTKDFETLYNLA